MCRVKTSLHVLGSFCRFAEQWSAQLLLTLYPVLFHFLDFSDRLPQVVGKLLAVLRIGCVEIDEDFDVCSRYGRGQPDSIWIIYRVTSHIFEKVVGITEHNTQKLKFDHQTCPYMLGVLMYGWGPGWLLSSAEELVHWWRNVHVCEGIEIVD